MKCIKCGSRRVAPILYGMPAFSEEMVEKLNNEKLYLGGCCISDAAPKYHCFGCKKEFGTPPILFSKTGQDDYRTIVTSILFSVGEHFGGYSTLEIRPVSREESARIVIDDKNGIAFSNDCPLILQECSGYNQITPPFQRVITQTEWKKILNQLFCKLYIHEWKKSYANDLVLDGKQWEFNITLTKGRHRHYHGSNAYPAYWAELKRLFRPFFSEAGIQL